MAASATAKPPANTARTRRPTVQVEQPPRRILLGGEWVDVSHLRGNALFEMITRDEEPWDYKRLAAETGRSVARLRKWVSNAYKFERTGEPEDDKTFIVPDNYIGDSPWWYGGKAREVLNKIGVMHRDGRAKPYKPTGRKPGAKDLAPRKRWEHAPARDAAAGIYREYLELTTRKRPPFTDDEARAAMCQRHNLTSGQLGRLINAGGDPAKKWDSTEARDAAFNLHREYLELTVNTRPPLTDREARAELCRRHDINRTQLARRIKAGKEQVDAQSTPVEVDAAALRARLDVLVAAQRQAGYSERGANDRARAKLAEETGLTRRQLAGYIAGAEAEEKTG